MTIEQLTPQQQALIPVYQKKWQQIAFSTEPIDREKAAESVKFAYTALGYKAPQIVICDSPRVALDCIFLPIYQTCQESPSWRKIKQEITAVFGHTLTYKILSQMLINQAEIFRFYILNAGVEQSLSLSKTPAIKITL